jgi:hypothetical protein
MPCLVSLTGEDSDFQSLSWATWATFTPYHCLKADRANVEALACKTGLSGFESRRYLQALFFRPRMIRDTGNI